MRQTILQDAVRDSECYYILYTIFFIVDSHFASIKSDLEISALTCKPKQLATTESKNIVGVQI